MDTPPPHAFPHIENLVFEGGGVHGMAYIGALQFLEDVSLLEHLQSVGGTSIGALLAVAVALKLTPAQIHEDFCTLSKDAVMPRRCFLEPVKNLVGDWGLNSLRPLRAWIDAWLERRTGNKNVTFTDVFVLNDINLHIAVYNRSKARDEIINQYTHPDMPISPCLVAAMAVPFVFVPARLPGSKDMYIDGGMTNNFPIYLFDNEDSGGEHGYNEHTLGLRTTSNKSLYFATDVEYEVPPPRNIVEYYMGMVDVLMEASQQRHERERDAERTCFIVVPSEISSLNFDVTEETREQLYDIGYERMAKTFDERNIVSNGDDIEERA